MSVISVIVSVILLLTVLLKLWNYVVRRYNHRILLNSTCDTCGKEVGLESLNEALEGLEEQKDRLKKEGKIGDVKLFNMELICSNCGGVNLERDLYKEYRNKKRKV